MAGTVTIEPARLLVRRCRRRASGPARPTRPRRAAARPTVVTTGTWCGLLEAQAGDAVHVEFDGIGDARVQL
jgi:hypothetical protein